jgi:hypothetical protein
LCNREIGAFVKGRGRLLRERGKRDFEGGLSKSHTKTEGLIT